jgi:hypothetical protein
VYIFNSKHLPYSTNKSVLIDKPRINACVRTKNSIKHMHEFITFHSQQGITSFSIYDDTDRANSIFFNKYQNVKYTHVGKEIIPNENHFIWECMKNAFLSNKYDYILNMDDDEFIYSTKHDRISEALVSNNWFEKSWCIANPVFFFGTTMSNNTGKTTVDFINRDRDVSRLDTILDTEFARYVSPTSDSHVKKRIEKAIFKVPKNASKLLHLLKIGIKKGSLIHGYSLGCKKQHDIKVAHYTRSDDQLKDRIRSFWTNVHGLRKRFSNDNKIKNYKLERNRTEVVDDTVKKISIHFSEK